MATLTTHIDRQIDRHACRYAGMQSRTQAQAQPIVDGAGNSRTGTQSFASEANASPADPLLAALWAARKAEEELPSAPLAQGRAAAPVPEVGGFLPSLSRTRSTSGELN